MPSHTPSEKRKNRKLKVQKVKKPVRVRKPGKKK